MYGVRRHPAVLGDVGIVDPDFGRAGRALLGELPQPERRPVQRFGGSRQDVLGRDALVDGPDEAFELVGNGVVEPLARMGGDFADAIDLRFSCLFRHFCTVRISREKKLTRMSKPHKGATRRRILCMVASRKADWPFVLVGGNARG